MDVVATFILVAATAALILGPLVRTSPSPPRTPRSRDRAVARKQALELDALQELEFDFETGKVSEEDYTTLRQQFRAATMGVVSPPLAPAPIPAGDARIEAEIAAARAQRHRQTSEGVRHCTACGARLPSDARFCPGCGAAVGQVRS